MLGLIVNRQTKTNNVLFQVVKQVELGLQRQDLIYKNSIHDQMVIQSENTVGKFLHKRHNKRSVDSQITFSTSHIEQRCQTSQSVKTFSNKIKFMTLWNVGDRASQNSRQDLDQLLEVPTNKRAVVIQSSP
ncbi:hypothetical protein BD560DRAFT_163247 [Blakeslea trispora]|nr:hypothetical protein BD560DRAFT_163247 [Blakeslea trispora]